MSEYAQRVDGHYSVGGVLYPAISTVLKPLRSGFYGTGTFYTDRGELAHLAAEHAMKHNLKPLHVADWLKEQIAEHDYDLNVGDVLVYATAAVEWVIEYVEGVDHIEVPCVSSWGRYAGRPDFRGARLRGSDACWVADFKTASNDSPDIWHIAQVLMQGGFTHIALRDGWGDEVAPCTGYANVYLTPKGAQMRTWKQADLCNALCWVAPRLQSMERGWPTEDEWHLMDGWVSGKRPRAGYWPPRPAPSPRPSAADRRARASAEQWGHMPQEVG